MEKIVLDSAIKFGAGRYRQDRNILKECGQEIRRFTAVPAALRRQGNMRGNAWQPAVMM